VRRGGLLAGAEVLAVIDIEAIGDGSPAEPGAFGLEHGEELILAVEATVGAIDGVGFVFHFAGADGLERNGLFAGKLDRVAVLAARQRGRIGDDGQRLAAKHAMGAPGQVGRVDTPGIGHQQAAKPGQMRVECVLFFIQCLVESHGRSQRSWYSGLTSLRPARNVRQRAAFALHELQEFAIWKFYAILKRRMAVVDPTHHLSPRVRAARRKLLFQDSVALLTLVLIVVVLSSLTYLLHRSFENHRQELGHRWRQRGEMELQKGQSQAAIEALRAALSYIPDRSTEIELAEALAQAGRTQEAVAYFNTLRDQEPGSGIVNLQLARLAVRQNQQAQAINYYQTALDGTWEGDGYERRRDVRLEMAKYLIQVHEFSHARTELLIAAGNAPDKPALKLEIAGLLEQCQSPADALDIYRSLSHRRNPPWAALAGAGRTAYELGEFALAHNYLDRATDAHAFRQQPQAEQTMIQQKLKTTEELLALYPADDLTIRERAARVLEDVRIARNRFENCQAPIALQPLASAPINTPQIASGSLPVNPLARAAAKAKSLLTPSAAQTAAQALVARWAKVPQKLRLFDLEQNPEMEQMLMQLVYDTEKDAANRCGTPQGNDALLYTIAQAPYMVEQR